jgi:hypothetical protein
LSSPSDQLFLSLVSDTLLNIAPVYVGCCVEQGGNSKWDKKFQAMDPEELYRLIEQQQEHIYHAKTNSYEDDEQDPSDPGDIYQYLNLSTN